MRKMLSAAVVTDGLREKTILPLFQLVLLFSGFYIKYYMSKTESEWSTTISAILALSITLFTTALIPVDVFLVSFMKNSDGSFKDWAVSNATRNSVEESVLIGYYGESRLYYWSIRIHVHVYHYSIATDKALFFIQKC